MSKKVFVDFHVLQTVPPSCVNRDDTGSPKTAIYGGTMRARVSSQAWKRAIRKQFMDELPENCAGIRTRNIVKLLGEEISKEAPEISPEKADELADKMFTLGKAKGDGKDVLFFISKAQIRSLAKRAVEYNSDVSEYDSNKKKNDEKKDKYYEGLIKGDLNENPAIDMALFGRMSASNPALNYDAACQVAHAISTHTINNEFDYFSAVDDFSAEDNAGAGHLGTVEYNSATLYRYATLNVDGLARYIDESEIPGVVREFADAFIRSMPTGKQNTFANRTLPDMIYVTIRGDQPVNLAGAFEKPVSAGDRGYVDASKKRIAEYAEQVYTDFAEEPEKSWVVGCEPIETAEKVSLKEMLDQLEAAVAEQRKG